MNLNLEDKVAVVLAGSAGIGRGIATVLGKEGCKLAICGRNEPRLHRAGEEIRREKTNQNLKKPCNNTSP